MIWWGFLGSPVVKTPCFQCRGHGLDPWSDLTCCVMWPKKKKRFDKSLSLGVRIIFTLQNFWYNLTLSEIKLILWGIIFKLCVCECVCGYEASRNFISLMEKNIKCLVKYFCSFIYAKYIWNVYCQVILCMHYNCLLKPPV